MIAVNMHEAKTRLSELVKAVEERDSALAYAKIEPMYDPLRSDPRFQDLLRRMNFPP